MADKRLVMGYVKQSEVFNRILEEDRCWREYENRKRDRVKHFYRKSSKSPLPLLHSRSDSAEREWRRERKRKLEENSHITASAAAPTTALDFWRQVVRCSGDVDGRWGHDGFKELEKPGPPTPLSADVHLRLQTNLSVPKSSSSSTSPSCVLERIHNKRKRGKKTSSKKNKAKKVKRRAKKKRTHNSSSSSFFSSDSDQDVEWVEKKP